MNTNNFNDDQVSYMIAFFADRLNLIFAHFFCTIEFAGDKDFGAPATLKDTRKLV